jgi:hypothetical protein
MSTCGATLTSHCPECRQRALTSEFCAFEASPQWHHLHTRRHRPDIRHPISSSSHLITRAHNSNHTDSLTPLQHVSHGPEEGTLEMGWGFCLDWEGRRVHDNDMANFRDKVTKRITLFFSLYFTPHFPIQLLGANNRSRMRAALTLVVVALLLTRPAVPANTGNQRSSRHPRADIRIIRRQRRRTRTAV